MTVQQLRDQLEEMSPDAEVVVLRNGLDDPRVSRVLHVCSGNYDDCGEQGWMLNDDGDDGKCVLIY